MFSYKKAVTTLLAFIICLASANAALAANTYTVTLPASTEVTMQDPEASLPFTITNVAGSTRDIREIDLTVDTAKYEISTATTAPAGWCVKDVSTGTVTFALTQGSGACSSGTTASELAPGDSLVFSLTALPLASASDVTGDTLLGASVASQGGFSLSGSLPTWTRRSLDASLVATPDSVGVGGEILLSMQVTNRSTATQSTIGATPAPPSPSSAIATLTDGPFYGSNLLSGAHSAGDSIITVADATVFPTSGTVQVGSEEICYTGTTATTLIGVTRGCNGTTAATHDSGSVVYDMTPFSLAAGATGTVMWKYSADISGSVWFTARGTGGGGAATSVSLASNTVVIGSFTAALAVSPASVVTGQTVTVTMTVKNNGTTSLVNVTPSALTPCAGGATETLQTSASPASISSLAPGATGVFTWTYSITGADGDAYCLTGSASADGPVSTNTATSNTGSVSLYSASVTPAVVPSGATNQTLAWTVYNGGGCGVKEVTVTTPAAGGDWACSSVAPPAGWSASCSGAVQFQSSNPSNDIASGSSKPFSITFSTTETVAADKVVAFPVNVLARGCGGSSATIGTYVTVSLNGVTLAHSPVGPVWADGSAAYTMTATLTTGGAPVAGKTISFTTTNGTLSPVSAVTDVNGEATVTLTAPNSTTDTTADVTAAYLSASGTDTVSFTGWTLANLQYWGGLTTVTPPANTTVDCGSAYSIQMQVRNISGAAMTPGAGSYFAFNDSAGGGSGVFVAYLDSGSQVAIPVGNTATLTFGSPTSGGTGGDVTVDPTFTAGTYTPSVNSAPPPESGLFFTDGGTNDQYRAVTDTVTVAGTCGTVSVHTIEWHEMR